MTIELSWLRLRAYGVSVGQLLKISYIIMPSHKNYKNKKVTLPIQFLDGDSKVLFQPLKWVVGSCYHSFYFYSEVENHSLQCRHL